MGVVALTPCDLRRQELGRCLRAYRDLVGPRQVGLPAGSRRRAPGLRREEVAALAGVGVTWYTWLEQGRVTASDQVLDAVGRVLGIDDVGREHLRALSRPHDPLEIDPDGLRPLLASWRDDPAALLDARLDVVAANEAWTATFAPGRHVLEQLLASTEDVVPLVHALARRLRMATDRDPGDARLTQVRAQLRAGAPGLGALWDCRGVGAFGRPAVRLGDTRRTAHLLAEAGAIELTGAVVLVLLPDARSTSG
ncbi:helix-turn-helix domain-containing protein [Actinomycetospora aeridis]|uniref:Helix-turn-helix domain-containing protein n=1 Tax=Actinomycetospora aeridis TaxID=3129231 RepID=A0ABU8NEM1_9PSEU